VARDLERFSTSVAEHKIEVAHRLRWGEVKPLEACAENEGGGRGCFELAVVADQPPLLERR
jgi:hypothetical protein